MKSFLVWVVIIILVILGIWWWQKSPVDTLPVDTTQTNTQNDGAALPSTNVQSATASVAIENFAFSPKVLTVKKGTTVTWTNKDSVPHTVTVTGAAGASGPSSTTLATGATFSFTFDAAGTFRYACTLHPTMEGTVVVTE